MSRPPARLPACLPARLPACQLARLGHTITAALPGILEVLAVGAVGHLSGAPLHAPPPASAIAEEDLVEMRQAIAAGLAAVSGLDGWHIELVGGSRRHMRPVEAASQQEQQGEGQGQGQGPAADGGGGLAGASCSASASAGSASPARSTRRRHHDSDFMVTHSAGIWDDGLIERFRDWLIKQRRLVPSEDGAMTLLQVNPACSIGGPGHCRIWAPGRGFARGCVASMHAGHVRVGRQAACV